MKRYTVIRTEARWIRTDYEVLLDEGDEPTDEEIAEFLRDDPDGDVDEFKREYLEETLMDVVAAGGWVHFTEEDIGAVEMFDSETTFEEE